MRQFTLISCKSFSGIAINTSPIRKCFGIKEFRSSESDDKGVIRREFKQDSIFIFCQSVIFLPMIHHIADDVWWPLLHSSIIHQNIARAEGSGAILYYIFLIYLTSLHCILFKSTPNSHAYKICFVISKYRPA